MTMMDLNSIGKNCVDGGIQMAKTLLQNTKENIDYAILFFFLRVNMV